MLSGGRVADAADLRTAGDNVDNSFWSGLCWLINLVIISDGEGVFPLVGEEVLDMTSLEELGYL